MRELTENVLDWADERGILEKGFPMAQFCKTVSEVGELADHIGTGEYEKAKDDIGDITVTLIILAELIGSDLEECLAVAFKEIKDRKGKMVDGIFVKDE